LTTLENIELRTLVKEAYNNNAAFFDTAERYGSNWKTALGMGYGETETILNKYIRDATKNKVDDGNIMKPIIATKFTPTPLRTTVESVVKACEQSRERLGVDQIDLYQLHMPDIVQPLKRFGIGSNKNEIYWEGLAECYKRGLVKNVGVCNYGPTLLCNAKIALAKHDVPLASNQIAYSLIGRHNGAQETLDKCNELGIKVLAYYPFAMGLLTGKYSKQSLATLDDSLTTSSKTSLEIKDLLQYSDDLIPLLAEMESIAKRRKKTISQVALNYIISKGAVPIPGARNVSQLKDNIGAMGWRLSKSEIEKLEELAQNIGFEGAGFKRTSEKFVGYGVEKWSLD
jgi:pyridoxine 4-dehydrogenase